VSDLHQAVQAEIASHTPALPPSFEALKARKRARDGRRTAASVVVSALAVAGIALVPSAVRSDEGKAPAQVAQSGDAEVFAFLIKPAVPDLRIVELGSAALLQCLKIPGLSQVAVLYSSPVQFSGRVAGRENADAIKNCVRKVTGWGATLTPVAEGSPVPSASAAKTRTTTGPDGKPVPYVSPLVSAVPSFGSGFPSVHPSPGAP
jgi:hypothetical protein